MKSVFTNTIVVDGVLGSMLIPLHRVIGIEETLEEVVVFHLEEGVTFESTTPFEEVVKMIRESYAGMC